LDAADEVGELFFLGVFELENIENIGAAVFGRDEVELTGGGFEMAVKLGAGVDYDGLIDFADEAAFEEKIVNGFAADNVD